MKISHFHGQFGRGYNPILRGRKLTMVINHLLNGMILQVGDEITLFRGRKRSPCLLTTYELGTRTPNIPPPDSLPRTPPACLAVTIHDEARNFGAPFSSGVQRVSYSVDQRWVIDFSRCFPNKKQTKTIQEETENNKRFRCRLSNFCFCHGKKTHQNLQCGMNASKKLRG